MSLLRINHTIKERNRAAIHRTGPGLVKDNFHQIQQKLQWGLPHNILCGNPLFNRLQMSGYSMSTETLIYL